MIAKIICCILGIISFAAGLVGLVLPVIPQIPFFVAATVFMMIGSKRFAKWFRETALYKKHLEEHIKTSRFLSKILSGCAEEQA